MPVCIANFPNNASNINPIQMLIMDTNIARGLFLFKGSNFLKFNATVANTIIIVLLASHTNLDFRPSADYSPVREITKNLNPFRSCLVLCPPFSSF